jgi:uncharacterized protein YegL
MRTKIYNLIILDESGSMAAIKQPIIGAFNEIVQSINSAVSRHEELDQWISFYTFNTQGVKEVISLQKVNTIHELKPEVYHPDSMTPLYDAIGHAVNKLRYAIEKEKNYKVLVTILTDGAENASKEFTVATIGNMIKFLEDKDWTFTYMGANQDVEKVASRLNIRHFTSWSANIFGVDAMLNLEDDSRKKFYHKTAKLQKLRPDENYFDQKPDAPDL